jgi:hypothetical protein
MSTRTSPASRRAAGLATARRHRSRRLPVARGPSPSVRAFLDFLEMRHEHMEVASKLGKIEGEGD